MGAEQIENMDSHTPKEKPTEDLQSESSQQDNEHGSRNITWTLKCLQGKIDPKAYARLRSEINWAEVGDDGTMTFSSSDRDEIFAFSNKIKTIFAEKEENNLVEALSFSMTSRPL